MARLSAAERHELADRFELNPSAAARWLPEGYEPGDLKLTPWQLFESRGERPETYELEALGFWPSALLDDFLAHYGQEYAHPGLGAVLALRP